MMQDSWELPSTIWTKTDPTTFERRLDHIESFFHFMSRAGRRQDRMNWVTTTAVRVRTTRPDFIGDVKEAWKLLRLDHPILSAFIEDGRWIYHVATDSELSSWLRESFCVHNKKSARELFPFDTNPLRRAVLHVFPRTQEIALQAPHTHVDGIGMVTFLHNLLAAMTRRTDRHMRSFGKESANLTPSMIVTAKIPQYTSQQLQDWNEIYAEYQAQFPTMRLRWNKRGQPATTATMQWLTFSPKETKQIALQSRKHGFTVTCAAQAAISQAIRIHGQVKNRSHATFAIYNARANIDEQRWPHRSLVSQHLFAMPATFPVTPESFPETARAAKVVLTRLAKNGLHQSPLFCSQVPARLKSGLVPGMADASDMQLSSMGILDKFIDGSYPQIEDGRSSIEVKDLWVALEILHTGIAAEMWTFRGRLVIQLIYNEAFHRDESVKLLLGLIHEQLEQGLGIDLCFRAEMPGIPDCDHNCVE